MTFLVIYIGGYLLCWRPLLRLILASENRLTPGDVIFLVIICSYFGIFWPAFIVYKLWEAAFSRLEKRGTDRQKAAEKMARVLAGENKDQKIKRLELEKKEREVYVERLERETGIGQHDDIQAELEAHSAQAAK